jgi:small subunit ribosomal protein S17
MAEAKKATKKPAAATKAKAAAAKPKAAAAPKPAAARKPVVAKVRKEGAVDNSGRDSTRKTREGLVVSNKMEKTVVVEIARRTQHPIYGKVVIRTTKFKAHDIVGCDIGDRVEIMETRPISKDKRWRVTQILEKVK